MESKHKTLLMETVRETEEEANVYRESLLEMSQENNQLYNDYCKLYDLVRRISVRTEATYVGISSPEASLSDIESMIENANL